MRAFLTRSIRQLVEGSMVDLILRTFGAVLVAIGVPDSLWDWWWNPPQFMLSPSFRPAIISLGFVLVIGTLVHSSRNRPISIAYLPSLEPQKNSTQSPDWPIRELFFHIKPDLLDDQQAKAWIGIGKQIIDKFSTGQLKVWGKEIVDSTRSAEAPIPPEHWRRCEFTFWFFKDPPDQSVMDVECQRLEKGTRPWQYASLRINRAEALTVWRPRPIERDIWLRDAIRYISMGTWNGCWDGLTEAKASDVYAALMVSLAEVRQAALDGKLPVWGRRGHHGTVFEQITPEYWKHYAIKDLSLLKDEPSDLETEYQGSGYRAPGIYTGLMTSRTKAEELWPRR